jgi:hypothetical protein
MCVRPDGRWRDAVQSNAASSMNVTQRRPWMTGQPDQMTQSKSDKPRPMTIVTEMTQ